MPTAFTHDPNLGLPSSTTDTAVVRWSGTTGGTLLSSGITIDNSNVMAGITSLTVDNLNLNGNTISSTAGTDLFITPLSGQQLILDGTIIIDAGVVTGATSITATEFHGGGGNLTGISAGATLSGSTDNTIVTVTGANAMIGEASLTFDNAALAFNRSHDGNNAINLINDSNTSSASTRLTIQTAGASAGDAVALFHAGGQSYIMGVDNSEDNKFKLSVTGGNLGTSDALVIDTSGRVLINPTAADNPAHSAPLTIKSDSNHRALYMNTYGTDADAGSRFLTYERGSGGSSGTHSYVGSSYTQIIPTGAGASRGGIVFVWAESDGDTTAFCDMVVVPVTGGFSNANYSASSSTAGTGNVIFRLNMRGSPPNRDYQLGAHNTLYMACSSGNWNVVTMTMSVSGMAT